MTVVINERDITKSREEILLDLLYEATSVRFELNWFTHGTPEELDATPQKFDDPNTYIPFKFRPNFRDDLSSQMAILYRRRSIKDHLAQYNFNLNFSRFPTTTDQIVTDLINPHLNFPLNTQDFIVYRIDDPDTTSIRIKARPDSLIWYGETTLPISKPGEEFFVLAQVTILGGFVPYAEPA